MQIKENANLTVIESPLLKVQGDAAYAEHKICKKTITDTSKHKSFELDMADGWLAMKPGKGHTEYVGPIKVTFFKMGKSRGYAILEPDNCTCKWSIKFPQSDLLFVKETIQLLSFKEN